ALGALTIGFRGHLVNAREELKCLWAQDRKRAYEAGTLKALCLVNTTTDLNEHSRAGQAVCEETLALYGVLDRDDWQDDPAWQYLDAYDRQRLAEDTRELLLMLAWVRVRAAPADQDVLRQALDLLDRSQAIRDLAP